MSAHRHRAKTGGRQQPMSEDERWENYTLKLSKEVSGACDGYQMRVNGYRYSGLRGIIKADAADKNSKKQ